MNGTGASLSDMQEEGMRQYLTFTVGEAECSVDIMQVREIRGWTLCTRLPNTPEYMRGVINLRGSIIPIFDLRCRFGNGLTQASEKHVIIILALAARTAGVLVDAVSDIVTLPLGALKDAPLDPESDVDKRFVAGLLSLDSRMIIHLAIEQLFHDAPEPAPEATAPPASLTSPLSLSA